MVWFLLVYLSIHSITLYTSIVDYNLCITTHLSINGHPQYNVINSNTKFKVQLEVQFVTTYIYFFIYIDISKC